MSVERCLDQISRSISSILHSPRRFINGVEVTQESERREYENLATWTAILKAKLRGQ